jgi:hypothetical protein
MTVQVFHIEAQGWFWQVRDRTPVGPFKTQQRAQAMALRTFVRDYRKDWKPAVAQAKEAA